MGVRRQHTRTDETPPPDNAQRKLSAGNPFPINGSCYLLAASRPTRRQRRGGIIIIDHTGGRGLSRATHPLLELRRSRAPDSTANPRGHRERLSHDGETTPPPPCAPAPARALDRPGLPATPRQRFRRGTTTPTASTKGVSLTGTTGRRTRSTACPLHRADRTARTGSPKGGCPHTSLCPRRALEVSARRRVFFMEYDILIGP